MNGGAAGRIGTPRPGVSLTDLESGLDDEQAALASLRGTADAEEGIRAFVEKREPGFRGS